MAAAPNCRGLSQLAVQRLSFQRQRRQEQEQHEQLQRQRQVRRQQQVAAVVQLLHGACLESDADAQEEERRVQRLLNDLPDASDIPDLPYGSYRRNVTGAPQMSNRQRLRRDGASTGSAGRGDASPMGTPLLSDAR